MRGYADPVCHLLHKFFPGFLTCKIQFPDMKQRINIHHAAAPYGINRSHSLCAEALFRKNGPRSYRSIPDIIPCHKLFCRRTGSFQILFLPCQTVKAVQPCHYILCGLLIHNIRIVHSAALIQFLPAFMGQRIFCCPDCRFFVSSVFRIFFCQRAEKRYGYRGRRFSSPVLFLLSTVSVFIHKNRTAFFCIGSVPGTVFILSVQKKLCIFIYHSRPLRPVLSPGFIPLVCFQKIIYRLRHGSQIVPFFISIRHIMKFRRRIVSKRRERPSLLQIIKGIHPSVFIYTVIYKEIYYFLSLSLIRFAFLCKNQSDIYLASGKSVFQNMRIGIMRDRIK